MAWEKYSDASLLVRDFTPLPPKVGAHVCRVATMPDGDVLVVAFHPTSGEPQFFAVLPRIPNTK